MSQSNIKKNIRLSNEFDTYIIDHPTAYRRIPRGAHIILTSSKDRSLSEANMAIAEHSRAGKFVIAHKTDGRWEIKGYRG